MKTHPLTEALRLAIACESAGVLGYQPEPPCLSILARDDFTIPLGQA